MITWLWIMNLKMCRLKNDNLVMDNKLLIDCTCTYVSDANIPYQNQQKS